MLLQKVATYFLGYIFIQVNGTMLEKFLNLIIQKKLKLWDISRREGYLTAKVAIKDFRNLRDVARKTKVRIRIRKKIGFPFLMSRLKQRRMLVVGALVSLGLLYTFSAFIWFVDVKGEEKIAAQRILKTAYSYGLRPGNLKINIDTKELERKILADMPDLAWVGINLKGTRAEIEVIEKTIVKPAKKTLCSIVASKDGLITYAMVVEGQRMVNEGDVVKKGQLLISGKIVKPIMNEEGKQISEEIKYVTAEGRVKARIWYEGYGEYPLEKKYTMDTGRIKNKYYVRLGDKIYSLQKREKITFRLFKKTISVKKFPAWRKIKIPVELIKVQIIERKRGKHTYPFDIALERAKQKAEKVILKKLPPDAQIDEKRFTLIEPELDVGKIVRVKFFVETIEDIAKIRPFSKEELITVPVPEIEQN